MNNIDEIKTLLSSKLELFVSYEQQTDALIDAQEDCVNNYITKRDELANNIDAITQKIIKCLEGGEKALENAVYCRGNYADYSAEQAEINNISSKIYACINRISEKNTLIADSIAAQKDATLEKIRQSKNTPKIKKYLGALGSQQNEGILSGNI